MHRRCLQLSQLRLDRQGVLMVECTDETRQIAAIQQGVRMRADA
jgi:hypothetical protein